MKAMYIDGSRLMLRRFPRTNTIYGVANLSTQSILPMARLIYLVCLSRTLVFHNLISFYQPILRIWLLLLTADMLPYGWTPAMLRMLRGVLNTVRDAPLD